MTKPKFRDSKTLTKEQATDPDYAKKKIRKKAKKLNLEMSCSQCHHCR